MSKDKFKVMESKGTTQYRMFNIGDMAIVNDYRFDRRPLNEFEMKRGKRLSEKLDAVMDYIDNMKLD